MKGARNAYCSQCRENSNNLKPECVCCSGDHLIMGDGVCCAYFEYYNKNKANDPVGHGCI